LPDGNSIEVRVISGPLGSKAWAMPQVTVRFGPDLSPLLTESIAVESSSIALTNSFGLDRVDQSHWRVARRPWLASLVKSTGLKRGETASINTVSMVASRSGRRWIYRCDYDMACSESVALAALAPLGSELRSIEIDGSPIAIGNGSRAEFILPAERKQHHNLNVVWSSPDFLAVPVELRTAGELVVPATIDLVVGVPLGQSIEGLGEQNRGELPGFVATTSIRGSPHRFRLASGQIHDVHLIPESTGHPAWLLAAASGIWLLALLIALSGISSAGPLVAACISILTVLFVGSGAGLLILVPAAIFADRLRKLFQFLASGARYHDRTATTS
jgi:hypothetical protein